MSGALDNLISGSTGTSVAGKVYLGPNKGTPASYSGATLVPAQEGISVIDAKKKYITDPKVESGWLATLKRNGYGDVSPAKAKALYEMSVDEASKWYSESNGARKITPEQYLGWYAKDTGKSAEGGPSVSIQKYLFDPAEIQSLIDGTLKGVLGRKATESESKEFYTAIQKMIDQGTVTTTKKVGGKTITEQKPGFSKEKAEALITERVKTASPQDYQEKQSLDFADFLGRLKG